MVNWIYVLQKMALCKMLLQNIKFKNCHSKYWFFGIFCYSGTLLPSLLPPLPLDLVARRARDRRRQVRSSMATSDLAASLLVVAREEGSQLHESDSVMVTRGEAEPETSSNEPDQRWRPRIQCATELDCVGKKVTQLAPHGGDNGLTTMMMRWCVSRRKRRRRRDSWRGRRREDKSVQEWQNPNSQVFLK